MILANLAKLDGCADLRDNRAITKRDCEGMEGFGFYLSAAKMTAYRIGIDNPSACLIRLRLVDICLVRSDNSESQQFGVFVANGQLEL